LKIKGNKKKPAESDTQSQSQKFVEKYTQLFKM